MREKTIFVLIANARYNALHISSKITFLKRLRTERKVEYVGEGGRQKFVNGESN